MEDPGEFMRTRNHVNSHNFIWMLIMKKKKRNSTMFTNQERAADATEANTKDRPTKSPLRCAILTSQDGYFSPIS